MKKQIAEIKIDQTQKIKVPELNRSSALKFTGDQRVEAFAEKQSQKSKCVIVSDNN